MNNPIALTPGINPYSDTAHVFVTMTMMKYDKIYTKRCIYAAFKATPAALMLPSNTGIYGLITSLWHLQAYFHT